MKDLIDGLQRSADAWGELADILKHWDDSWPMEDDGYPPDGWREVKK